MLASCATSAITTLRASSQLNVKRENSGLKTATYNNLAPSNVIARILIDVAV